MSAVMTLPRHWPRLFLVVAAGVWFAAYQLLLPVSKALTTLLPVDRDTHLGGALQFFLYDTPKVLLLLAGIVFVMGMVNSYFTPERTRALGLRELPGHRAARRSGGEGVGRTHHSGEGRGDRDIMTYGVLATPGVVVDGKVVHSGSVPAKEKIASWLDSGTEAVTSTAPITTGCGCAWRA